MTRGGPRIDRQRRLQLARSFHDGGEHYDRVRPGYPPEAVDWLIPDGARDAADIGAGTGKLTSRLVEKGLDVHAVDPSADMLAQLHRILPDVATVLGTAEDTQLQTGSAEVVTVAQAWHWCDPLAASTELARVLRPGGTLALIWNQIDVSVPWVHRYTRISHAGDVIQEGFRPPVGPEFGPPETHVSAWTSPMTPTELVELAKSRSYYLGAGEATRAKVLANLRWYLLEHLGHGPHDVLELPYLARAWRFARH